jgi:hypothetical protein
MPWTQSLPTPGRDHIDWFGTTTVWTNAPALNTEILGAANRRKAASLQGRTRARLSVALTVAGVAGWTLSAAYSLDGGTSWSTLNADCVVGATTGTTVHGAWGTIPLAARTDVLVTLFGRDGNGVADPSILTATLELE